jgi:hypothetical protein
LGLVFPGASPYTCIGQTTYRRITVAKNATELYLQGKLEHGTRVKFWYNGKLRQGEIYPARDGVEEVDQITLKLDFDTDGKQYKSFKVFNIDGLELL